MDVQFTDHNVYRCIYGSMGGIGACSMPHCKIKNISGCFSDQLSIAVTTPSPGNPKLDHDLVPEGLGLTDMV